MADQKKIAGLIKTQFPEFYHEGGQLFIDFVTAYYEWLESSTPDLNKWIKPNRSSVQVVHGQANVVGTNTAFLTHFANGDQIALLRANNDYEIFSIDEVSNNTLIQLSDTKLPKFAASNTSYGNVASRANPGYYVRRTQDSLDIDNTTDEFLVWFKEMYLKNIQFNTITDTKTLIKHSLDLYRSKGTPRSVDLLFKIAFGVPAEVFYPQKDIFTTSSGDWHVPKYLELAPRENSHLLVNKQITGLTSGATAFCDAVVRKTVKGKLIDVAYISAISGNFQTNERVNPGDGSIDTEESPLIIGSLNKATILIGGEGFAVGDVFDASSNSGEQIQVRVANIETTTGAVNIALTDGGYAYSNNTVVLVSNTVLTLSNVAVNTASPVYFENFETISQPLANVNYSAATDTPAVGDIIYTYHANNDEKGRGEILAIEAVNSSAGEFQTTIISGDLDDPTIYTAANAESLTNDIYTDTTITANVMGYYQNTTIQLENVSGTFAVDEEIFQSGANSGGTIISVANFNGTNATMIASSNSDAGVVFNPTIEIEGATSGATANISSISIQVGVKDISNTFITTANNFLTGNTSRGGVNATVTFVSAGEGMTFSVSNTFDYEEYIDINSDLLEDYSAVLLDAAGYGFPPDPSGNATSNTIANLLSYSNTKIGRIKTLTGINPGDNYNLLPVVRLYDSATGPFLRLDTRRLEISSPTASFADGEVVTQTANDFRGLVVNSNSTVMYVEALRFEDEKDVIVTVNADTVIVGTDSGAEANVDLVELVDTAETMGNNAIVQLDLSTANGVISEIDIKDSGFGTLNGEIVTFSSADGSIATAIANTYTHGTARGFYRTRDGFSSNVKKIQDGEYWQNHSYEVRSSVSINKWEKMLREVVHVAGFALFGNLVYTSTADLEIALANSGTSSVVSLEYANNVVLDRAGTVIRDRGNQTVHERE